MDPTNDEGPGPADSPLARTMASMQARLAAVDPLAQPLEWSRTRDRLAQLGSLVRYRDTGSVADLRAGIPAVFHTLDYGPEVTWEALLIDAGFAEDELAAASTTVGVPIPVGHWTPEFEPWRDDYFEQLVYRRTA